MAEKDQGSTQPNKPKQRTGRGSYIRRKEKQHNYNNAIGMRMIQAYLTNKWGMDIDELERPLTQSQTEEVQRDVDNIIITADKETIIEFADEAFTSLVKNPVAVSAAKENCTCSVPNIDLSSQVDGLYDRPNVTECCREYDENSCGSDCSILEDAKTCVKFHQDSGSSDEMDFDDDCEEPYYNAVSPEIVVDQNITGNAIPSLPVRSQSGVVEALARNEPSTSRATSQTQLRVEQREAERKAARQDDAMNRRCKGKRELSGDPIYLLVYNNSTVKIYLRKFTISHTAAFRRGKYQVRVIKRCCFKKMISKPPERIYIVV